MYKNVLCWICSYLILSMRNFWIKLCKEFEALDFGFVSVTRFHQGASDSSCSIEQRVHRRSQSPDICLQRTRSPAAEGSVPGSPWRSLKAPGASEGPWRSLKAPEGPEGPWRPRLEILLLFFCFFTTKSFEWIKWKHFLRCSSDVWRRNRLLQSLI